MSCSDKSSLKFREHVSIGELSLILLSFNRGFNGAIYNQSMAMLGREKISNMVASK